MNSTITIPSQKNKGRKLMLAIVILVILGSMLTYVSKFALASNEYEPGTYEKAIQKVEKYRSIKVAKMAYLSGRISSEMIQTMENELSSPPLTKQDFEEMFEYYDAHKSMIVAKQELEWYVSNANRKLGK